MSLTSDEFSPFRLHGDDLSGSAEKNIEMGVDEPADAVWTRLFELEGTLETCAAAELEEVRIPSPASE